MPAPAPNGPASGCMSEKPPPVPWQQLVSTFETTSEAKPGTAPLIVANTTLEQDKETVLRCFLAMGGREDVLRGMHYDEDAPACPWKMREELSDDLSEWWGVTVQGGRVVALNWTYHCLTGIPAEIGALSALTKLDLKHNNLNGAIPPTIGALSSLKVLDLNNNSLSGVVPYSLSNLLNLDELKLRDNDLSDDQNRNFVTQNQTQAYLNSFFRHPTIRLLNYVIAITKKRQAFLGRRISPRRATPPPHPFFAFLADHEHSLTDLIMSFLDPCYCCNEDRTALLKCWKSLGGAEDKLKQGHGDDFRGGRMWWLGMGGW